MPRGERLFRFLASLMMRDFYGTVKTRFEAGKVTHVETATKRTWEYQELPVGTDSLSTPSHRTRP
ncbi:MAG: hypothetical protein AMK73_01830 [Planctomycetes bacterium SM23_32]|nr:MAG: hypothetical protein AMK73_01830 [Planctomycetes bacterium SM23_32]